MSEQPFNTLSERLALGALPVAEAQQYATALADALRRLHDQGSVMGTLEPSRIMLSGPTVKLVAAESATGITPYASPEQLEGNSPDARSDIFAYGAIVHEMLSGRKAFEGSTPDELRTAILEREPAPLPPEFAEFAKIISKCLAKGPLQRWQRIQRVQMELKILTVFARRASQDTAAKADRMQELIHSQIAELEARLSSRLEMQDEKLRAAAQTEQLLRDEISALEAKLRSRVDATHDLADSASAKLVETEQALRAELAALEARLCSRLDTFHEAVHSTSSRINETEQALRSAVAALEARLASRIDAHDTRSEGLEKLSVEHQTRLAAMDDAAVVVSARLSAIDQALKTHSSSIQSLESAIAQTDDLVERVVEALDSLERSFAEQNEIKVLTGRN
jgi:hypothetical protein